MKAYLSFVYCFLLHLMLTTYYFMAVGRGGGGSELRYLEMLTIYDF